MIARWRYVSGYRRSHAIVTTLRIVPVDANALCGETPKANRRWLPDRPRTGGPLAASMWCKVDALPKCRKCVDLLALRNDLAAGGGS